MKSMRKNTWLPLIGLRTFLFVTTAFTIVSCSDDKEEDGYNPNLPVRISELSPQEGGYFDKVILQGENFGNNPKKVRVFFNKKEAIVVGASGDRVLVHVPKLPGDDCKIGMLLNGNTTDTIFAEKHFAYEKNYQLIYVAGQLNSNTETFVEGSLETTTFANSMQHLACDPSGIIYMNHKIQVKVAVLFILMNLRTTLSFWIMGHLLKTEVRLALRIMMKKQRRFTSVRTMLHFFGKLILRIHGLL
ncbi:hypothetical protein DW991_07035 [Bacteroides thetaiotaomicron]|nr:hypothetical protein DW991_07035 [Bacteroides thetaiotaomicron]